MFEILRSEFNLQYELSLEVLLFEFFTIFAIIYLPIVVVSRIRYNREMKKTKEVIASLSDYSEKKNLDRLELHCQSVKSYKESKKLLEVSPDLCYDPASGAANEAEASAPNRAVPKGLCPGKEDSRGKRCKNLPFRLN